MNRTVPLALMPTTSRPHGPVSTDTFCVSLSCRSASANSVATSRHSPALFGAAYAAMVNRPLGVITHTALGTPIWVSSTWSWPVSGTGIKTEPRLSRATSA